MKVALTAKLKLHTTPEQFKQVRQTQLAYRAALNYASRYAYEHGKMSNKVRLQDGTYRKIRTRYGIPAQMACSIPRQVGATYKGLWTKAKKNAALRKGGLTKKRYKGLDDAPKYVSPTLEYQLGHDYSFKTESQVSILTLSGRVIVHYTGYSQHTALIQHGASIGAAKLWYDQPKKQFYLLVSLEVEVPDPTPDTQTSIIGVDVGIRYLAVASDPKGQASFHCGKRLVPQANHYARLRKRLQQKGTQSATHRLRQVARRERRLKADANRPNKGLLFVCQVCHSTLHADLVGARNIALRTLLARQDWARTGILSVCPDASSDEAKAARLQRYAELWWSLDASPRL
jgi:putative transposase